MFPASFLRVILAVGVVVCAGGGSVRAEETSGTRPNILWITCEDMSADLGCYGDRQAWTPNIDRLAGEGTRFTGVYTVAPVCAPSRSALITGYYPTEIGTQHMRSKVVPPAGVKCFPEYLRAAGYYCTNNSKTDYNFKPPFAAWDENSKRAHWRNRPAGAPFFSVFNLTVTHESKFHMNEEEAAAATSDVPPEKRHRPENVLLPPYYPDTPVVRKDWARYQDMISAMDVQVGRILAELEEDGLSSNTVVFFFSDHGRGLPRGKRWVYDSGLHVPLVVRWPGELPPASVNGELVSFIDFAPTVLGIAGAKAPAGLRGRAFLGERKGPEPEYVFAARDRMDETPDTIRAARDKRYKYIRNFEPERPYAQVVQYGEKTPTMKELRRLNADGQLSGPQTLFFRPTKPAEELYDTQADPHEIRDLAGSADHEAVRKRMREALERWQKETGDLGLIPEEEMLERMRPGGVELKTAAPSIEKTESGDGTTTITLSCATEGASIVWRAEGGTGAGAEGDSRWHLYTGPFTVDRGARVSAVASRAGYADSE